MTARKPMSKRTRFEVFSRDGFACRYCGRKASETSLHVDHVVPLAENGLDVIENMITACADCNLGKGAQTLAKHAQRGDPLGLARSIEEQRRIVESMLASAKLRERAEQELVNFWCEQTGRSRVDSETFRVVYSYIREFGVEKIHAWIAQAANGRRNDDESMGRYVSGARRAESAAIMAILSRNGSRPIDATEVAMMVREWDLRVGDQVIAK